MSEGFSNRIKNREFKEFINLVMKKAKLTNNQEYVLSNTYGLNGREKTMTEIADEINTSRQAVFNTRKYALMKMRNAVKGLRIAPKIKRKQKALFAV